MQLRSETRFYRVGGVTAALNAPAFEERKWLAPFRIPAAAADIHYDVLLGEDIPLPAAAPFHETGSEAFFREEGIRCRVLYNERTGGVLLKDVCEAPDRHRIMLDGRYQEWFGTNLALRIMDLPRNMLELGGVFLHASFIEVGGKAILFTAPKQTGKSTQAELWRVHRKARIVNGDRALLRRIDGVWHACGSPYCGTSRICEAAELPIRAVVCLRQSEINEAAPANTRQALAALLDGCSYDTWDSEAVERVLALAGEILEEVPFVNLACTPDERAVTALEDIL